MKLKKTRKVMLCLLGAMTLSLLLGAVLAAAAPMAGLFFVSLGTILFLVFISYSFSHWRCPHCGEYLGWSLGKGIPFCPHCIGRLDL